MIFFYIAHESIFIHPNIYAKHVCLMYSLHNRLYKTRTKTQFCKQTIPFYYTVSTFLEIHKEINKHIRITPKNDLNRVCVDKYKCHLLNLFRDVCIGVNYVISLQISNGLCPSILPDQFHNYIKNQNNLKSQILVNVPFCILFYNIYPI